jgi:hypothetical protein
LKGAKQAAGCQAPCQGTPQSGVAIENRTEGKGERYIEIGDGGVIGIAIDGLKDVPFDRTTPCRRLVQAPGVRTDHGYARPALTHQARQAAQ